MAGNQLYAKRYFEAAVDFFEKGDYGKAIEHINKAIDKAPADAEIISTKGVFLHRLNDLPGAVEAYLSAIRACPQHQFSHFNLGLIYMKMGNVTQAIQEWEAVIRLNPNDIDALFNIAVALAQIGKRSEAILFYLRVLKLNPSHVQTHQNLGLIYRDERHYEKARYHLTRLKELDSTYSEVVDREIVSCTEQEFLDKLAASSAVKVTSEHLIGTDDITILIQDALIACISGDYELGLQLAQQILALHPEDLEARLIRGQAYAGLNRPSDAIAEFMAITASYPEKPEAYFHLGTLFLGLGELEKALDYFQHVLRLAPHYSLVKENIANIERKILESKPHTTGSKSS